MRTQDRKILLFMDNCGAHPHLELSNIELAFLPPNTTSKLQPMDAGIIQTTKVTYRKKLLRHVLFLMDEANAASDIAKQITVLDAILWMRSAWNTVTAETITKCFAKCGFTTDQPSTDTADDDLWDADDLLPLLPAGVTLQDYVAADDSLDTQNHYTDNWEQELMQYNRGSSDTPDSAEEDSADEEVPSNPKISTSTAWSHTADLRQFALQTNNTRLLELVSSAQDLLQEEKMKSLTHKQATMDRFLLK